MDNIEDHFHSIRTEWHMMKEKWFQGEMMDPVYEGVVRDFCTFDDTMHAVYNKVQVFMRGVENLASGMTALSEGVSGALSHYQDSQIASDSCKLKEATNQIARSDAPHSAIAKLRRDMHFNILTPVQNHISNNRNLKVSLDIRRRRLIELNTAKKAFEDVVKKNLPHTDRRYLQAQANFESAKMTFNDVDRHVFEWLYILEEYRGDIMDSTLQTLKYLEYEFFASSAHAISTSLPSRMEFRPMVEMTPEHLEAQVDMELQKSEESEMSNNLGGADTTITDFSARLIDKKVKEEPSDEPAVLPVDPLSLSSLLSQGFEEGPARKALRKHQNNTQAALDYLINGQAEEEEKKKLVSDGVRMPTTVKRVQKLKAMRRAQAEKIREKKEAAESGEKSPARSSAPPPAAEERKETPAPAPAAAAPAPAAPAPAQASPAKAPAPPQDMLSGDSPPVQQPAAPPVDLLEVSAAPAKPSAPDDLLSLGEEKPAVPTDFSKPLDITALPQQYTLDLTKCEKPPIPAAVAAGIVQARENLAPTPASGLDDVFAAPSGVAAAVANAALAASAPASTGAPGGQSLDPFSGLGGASDPSPPATADASPAKSKDPFANLSGF